MELKTTSTVKEKESALLDFIDKIETLIQFQDKIPSPSELDQIWDIFHEDITSLLRITVCGLFLVNETHEFTLRKVSPAEEKERCRDELYAQIDCGVFSWVINRKKPAFIPGLIFESDRTIILLPLATAKKTLGVVLCVTQMEESSVTRETRKLLAMLAKQCALVMENTLLYDDLRQEHEALKQANAEIKALSITDALTGCYNRGYLMERLNQEIKRSRRYESALSVLLCDVDYFKKVNDTYGHQVGDQVLVQFVKNITESIRTDIDWAARYGGEEFAIILPETPVEKGEIVAERIRLHIAEGTFQCGIHDIGVSASFGLTGITPETAGDNISAESLLSVADRYLYQAKNGGRNNVVSGPYSDER